MNKFTWGMFVGFMAAVIMHSFGILKTIQAVIA